MNVMEMFRNAGFVAYPISCAAGFTFLLALGAIGVAISGRKRGLTLGLAGAALLLGVLTVGLGVLGYFLGMNTVMSAVAAADPDQRTQLIAVGQAEAMDSIWCAVMGSALPLLLSIGALARGLTIASDAPNRK